MPIDPASLLGARHFQGTDPMAVMSALMQFHDQGIQRQQQQELRAQQAQLHDQAIQEGDIKLGETRRALAEDDAIRQILQRSNGDLSKALPEIAKINPAKAYGFQKMAMDADGARVSWVAKHLPDVQDESSHQFFRHVVGSMGFSLDDVPEHFDPAWKTREMGNAERHLLTFKEQGERADKLYEREHPKPVELNPGNQLVNPTTGAVVASGPPKPPSYQSETFLLDGKPVKGTFDPTKGTYGYQGQDVTARAKPVPTQAAVTVQQGQSDAQSIADAIESGDQPPDTGGLYRLAGPVRAALARKGYDLTRANLDWTATKKHLATVNGAQQTRIRQAIGTASDSLNVIRDLAQKWDGGRFPILNRVNLAAAKGGAYGKDVASIATQLDGQITDVVSEIGVVYMGGNSPTDHALGLAEKNLRADWDKKVLMDMLDLADKNLRIRSNSITNAGAVLSGGVAAPAAAPATQTTTTAGATKGQTRPITLPGYPPGAEETFNGVKWIRTK